jgi:hypothetical protein
LKTIYFFEEAYIFATDVVLSDLGNFDSYFFFLDHASEQTIFFRKMPWRRGSGVILPWLAA